MVHNEGPVSVGSTPAILANKEEYLDKSGISADTPGRETAGTSAMSSSR